MLVAHKVGSGSEVTTVDLETSQARVEVLLVKACPQLSWAPVFEISGYAPLETTLRIQNMNHPPYCALCPRCMETSKKIEDLARSHIQRLPRDLNPRS